MLPLDHNEMSNLLVIVNVPLDITSNVTGRHQGPKCKLWTGVACTTQFCKLFKFSRQLRVSSYSFPFHMHILRTCIWYGTVLVNTAVLCLCICIVCLLVRGAPAECYYSIVLRCNDISSSNVVSHAFSALFVYSKFEHPPHPIGLS